jgi:hypothetical protein
MSPDLEANLYQNYPALFKSLKNPEYPLIGCGDGWYQLIDAVSRVLVAHNAQITADQVKEKLAELRFYHSPVDDYSYGVEMFAVLMSKVICETCGARGHMYLMSESGLRGTRCHRHAAAEGFSEMLYEYFYDPEPGIGMGWSLIINVLNIMAAFNHERNGMPEAQFDIARQGDRLKIALISGNEMTRGMVALANTYAAMIDEYSGHPVEPSRVVPFRDN